MNMSKKHAIGIDLGGTNLRVALVSEDGEIIRKIKRPSSERIVDSILESLSEIGHEGVRGIGLGIAGLIDRKNNRVFASPNLRAVEGLDIVGELRRRFDVPVFIENDANAAALGEKIGGAGRGFNNFVLLTLGTGIGGGMIYKGELVELSSEIGHMSINADAEKCPCGNIGCLENYASARAMVSKAVALLEKGSESLLSKCCKGSIYKITPEDIYRIALEGDTLSREILRDAGKYLGVGLANIINIMSPEAIILAGGLIGAWNIYIQEAIKEASRRAYKDLFDSVKIVSSSLGDNAGIIGAACIVFKELSRNSSLS
ncbi:Transcriptional regulator [Candidatus Sulfobium mesophilum]|uniref:Transcriptional regulator n=1 Tax=Candidatus Sulfobium mesophilum TaxID=2016548 RepID=A0A2U3QG97_9BACT|nr:Transcriptional regulator [Candidatus Sulfobium mesophilum]